MEAATETRQAAPPPRLRDTFRREIHPMLLEKFGYGNPMQVPRLVKITLNMGLGSDTDARAREKAAEELALIAGQRPNFRQAKKSIASFKVREGMPVGVSVTSTDSVRSRVPGSATSAASRRLRSTVGATTRWACASS
jgi:large subunit ribosomal protein L5